MRPAIVLPATAILAALLIAPLVQAEDLSQCRKGLTAARAGKLDEALKLYDTCFRVGQITSKSRSLWHYNRANIYLAKGKYREAIKDYSEAIRLRPTYSLAHGSRGLAYEATGRNSEAMADFKKAEDLGMRSKWLKNKLRGG